MLFEQEESKPKKKKVNELDGKTWLKYSISVWNDIVKTKEEASLKHPAMFPMELPMRLIRMFTNDEQKRVLDPFMGVGSTLVAALECGKQGIGFEISEEYAKIARNRLESQQKLFTDEVYTPIIYVDDARNIDKYLDPETIDLCITSPPYWDILSEKRTADLKEKKDYEKKEGNLSEIKSYKEFLLELKEIFKKVFKVLKKGSYCIINVMDIRKKDKYYTYHMDISNFMIEIGFILDDIIIWDRRKEYNNLKPLGYPYVFRINKVHEYLLIFIKPKRGKQ